MLFSQAQMAKQQAQTKTAEDRLGRVEQEEAELKTRVKELELHLNTSVSIKELQVTERFTGAAQLKQPHSHASPSILALGSS